MNTALCKCVFTSFASVGTSVRLTQIPRYDVNRRDRSLGETRRLFVENIKFLSTCRAPTVQEASLSASTIAWEQNIRVGLCAVVTDRSVTHRWLIMPGAICHARSLKLYGQWCAICCLFQWSNRVYSYVLRGMRCHANISLLSLYRVGRLMLFIIFPPLKIVNVSPESGKNNSQCVNSQRAFPPPKACKNNSVRSHGRLYTMIIGSHPIGLGWVDILSREIPLLFIDLCFNMTTSQFWSKLVRYYTYGTFAQNPTRLVGSSARFLRCK